MAFVNNAPPPHGDGSTNSTLRNTAPSGGSSSANEVKEFRHKITEKLHDENFVLWKQQIEPVIKAHRLHHFLVSPRIPPRFLTKDDRVLDHENPAYQVWEAQDQMLLSWLQTLLSTAIEARAVGSNYTFELWEKIHSYFQKLGRTKIRQLRTDLRTTRLTSGTMKEYLAKIKSLVDSLASVGDPVLSHDHLDAILDGLPQEYDPIISIIESRFDDEATVAEAEALLLGQEVRLQRYRKQNSTDSASVLLTHTTTQHASASS